MRCRSGMRRCEPSDGFDGWLVKLVIVGDVGAGRIARGKFTVILRIHLLDPAKATELALMPVKQP